MASRLLSQTPVSILEHLSVSTLPCVRECEWESEAAGEFQGSLRSRVGWSTNVHSIDL